MYRIGLILLLCTTLFFQTKGQSVAVDSLQNVLQITQEPQKRLEILNALSSQYFDFDIEKAEPTTREAISIATKLKDRKVEAWTRVNRGIYYFISGRLLDAEETFKGILSMSETLVDVDLTAYVQMQLGNVFRDKGEYPLAQEWYSQSRRTIAESGRDKYQSMLTMNLSRFYLASREMDSALHYAIQTEKYRLKSNDRLSLADAWMQIGKCYVGKEDFKRGLEFLEKAYEVSGEDIILKAHYLHYTGEIYFRNGDFQRALKGWAEALVYYRKFQYKYEVANLLLSMSTVFEQQGYYDLANEYIANGVAISEKAPFTILLAYFFHEQSWVYFRLSNYELGLAASRRSEAIFKQLNNRDGLAGCWDLQGLILRNINQYDSSLYYHQLALKERKKLGSKIALSATYFNLGEYYSKLREFNKALPYYKQSLAIDKSVEDKYGISLNLNRLGRIYQDKKMSDSALYYFQQSMKLAIPMTANEIFRDNYIDLSRYYETMGHLDEALRYQRKYIALSDSIFSMQTAQSLASYKTLYDVQSSEQRIALLNKDNELVNARVQRQRIIIYIIVGGASVLVFMVIFYVRFARKLKKLNYALAEKNEEVQAQAEELLEANEVLGKLNRNIAEQKEEIQTQAEELTESNKLISKINEDLEARIEERTAELKEAFKELDTFFYRSSHDFRRPLTTFMGLAEVAKVVVKDQAALELFEKVNENARNLDKMLRKLQSFSDVGGQELIYKEVLIREIFELVLHKNKEALERRKIASSVTVNLMQPFVSYPALIKEVVENLVENSIIFSMGSDPYIHLSAFEVGDRVVLEVKDNGAGIDPVYHERVFEMYFRASDHSTGNGLGLYIVKKIAQRIQATIQLQSKPGEGTTITVSIPSRYIT